jgi:DNA-binding IclR family transcriptional regulator
MERSVSGVGVLDKAMVVLDALQAGPAMLAELMVRTGLPRATCHRLAVALESHGLVRRTTDGRFCLGHRLIVLANAAAAALPLRELARPALEALSAATGESAQLYVRDGHERVCVLAVESVSELRTIVPEGARLPLGLGSAGVVLGDGWTGDRPWAMSVGERAPGVASVSAPVHDHAGAVIAAVSISGPIERLAPDPGARYGADVANAARQIERGTPG